MLLMLTKGNHLPRDGLFINCLILYNAEIQKQRLAAKPPASRSSQPCDFIICSHVWHPPSTRPTKETWLNLAVS